MKNGTTKPTKIFLFGLLAISGVSTAIFSSSGSDEIKSHSIEMAQAADTPTAYEDVGATYSPTATKNPNFSDPLWSDFEWNGTKYTNEEGSPYAEHGSSMSDRYITKYYYNEEGWNTSETVLWKGTLYEHIGNRTDNPFSEHYQYFLYDMGEGKGTTAYNESLRTEFENKTNIGCIEMNSSAPAIFYQDLNTHGNDIIRWSLKHAARTETHGAGTPDTQNMKVLVGATPYDASSKVIPAEGTDSKLTNPATWTADGASGTGAHGKSAELKALSLSRTSSPDNVGWHEAAGVYVVPAGQAKTRFAFQALSTGAYGNLLDDIYFSTLVGNLSAIKNENGQLVISGYWGDTTPGKTLVVELSDGSTINVNMDNVMNKCFKAVIPSSFIGSETDIEVYHEDYPDGSVEVGVVHKHYWTYVAVENSLYSYCNRTDEAEFCRYQGFENAISIEINATDKNYDKTVNKASLSGSTAEYIASGRDLPEIVYQDLDSATYLAGAPKDAGSYKAMIFGVGSTSSGGTLPPVIAFTTFSINPIAIDTSKIVFDSIDDQTYTGSEIKPTVQITYNGDEILKQDKDFSVIYTNNIHTGIATATVTFNKNYTGTASTTFNIVPKAIGEDDVTVEFDKTLYEFTGSGIEPVLTVKEGEKTLEQGSDKDYTVSFTNNINVTTSTSKAEAKITFVKDYKETLTKEFEITPMPASKLDITLKQTSYEYTGAACEPDATVKRGSVGLTPNVDYTLSWQDNIHAGTAKAKLVFAGNYSGTEYRDFTITAKSAAENDFTITLNKDSWEYTGTAIEPTVTVVEKGTSATLTLNTDYEVSYDNNINVGTNTAVAKVKFIKDYTGTLTKNFSITPKTATSDEFEITLDKEEWEYTGAAIEPTPTVKFKATSHELASTEYEVSYENNVSKGTDAKVVVTFTNNYSGSLKKGFKIVDKTATEDDVTITLDKTSWEYTGSAIEPTVTVKQKSPAKDLVLGTDYTVEYSNNTNVTTTATVTITFIKDFKGSLTHQFAITPKAANETDLEISLNQVEWDYTGSEITPTAIVNEKSPSQALVLNTDYTVSYENNINAGTGKVKIEFIKNFSGTITKEFTIKKVSASTSNVTASLEGTSFTYTGGEITPAVTVKQNSPELDLVKDVDYTVEYTNNIEVGTNTGTATITFIKNFSGTMSLNFSITAKTASEDDINVTLDKDEWVYTGGDITPEETVSLVEGGTTLTKDVDYTVAYSNNRNVGTGKVTITFCKNYTGSIEKTFKIIGKQVVESDVTITLGGTSFDYTGSEITTTVSVKQNTPELTLVENTDYTVSYENNINAGTATVKITFIKDYSGTIERTFTINAVTATTTLVNASLTQTSFEYTGSAITPEEVIKQNSPEVTLVKGTDYTVSYSDNIAAGNGKVTITFIRNFKGSMELEFTITPKPAVTDDFTVTLEKDSWVYTGEAITPSATVVLKQGSVELVEDTDFTVSYENNINVGSEAKAIITFIKDYSGSIEKTFTITPKSASEAGINVSLDQDTWTFSGDEIKPTPSVSDAKGTLVKGTDYTVTYSNNVNVGTGKVIVTFIKNYSGSIEKTFTINPMDASGFDIDLDQSSFTYNREPATPSATIYNGGIALVEGVDFDITYSDNVNVGTGKATITYKGNYTGTGSKTFTITAKDSDGLDIVIEQPKYEYTGEEIKPVVTIKDGDYILKEGVDYKVTYTDNTKIGTGKVNIEFIGNYAGNKTADFQITQEKVVVAKVNHIFHFTVIALYLVYLITKAVVRNFKVDNRFVVYSSVFFILETALAMFSCCVLCFALYGGSIGLIIISTLGYQFHPQINSFFRKIFCRKKK